MLGQYGHQLHVWDLKRRKHTQTIDLGPEQQMVLELRPAHNPTRAYGFVGVVVSTADLAGRSSCRGAHGARAHARTGAGGLTAWSSPG